MTGGYESDPNDARTDEHPAPVGGGSMVLFEFAVPTGAFVLEDALREFPDVIVEYEHVVPTNHSPLPFLWTNDRTSGRFKDAAADDPTVRGLETIGSFDAGTLYRVEWSVPDGGLLQWITGARTDVALLDARGRDDVWILKVRFPCRGTIAEFRAFCDDCAVDPRVIHLSDLADPRIGQYDLTRKQEEALDRALEMGYFEIPRGCTLEAVAESLGISARSVSERLRRGQTNLIANTVNDGLPTGVGLDER